MENQKIEKLQNLYIVAKPKLKDKLSKLLIDNGAHSISTIYGHGSVSKNILAQAFGLDAFSIGGRETAQIAEIGRAFQTVSVE